MKSLQCWSFLLAVLFASHAQSSFADTVVDFAQDVQPILVRHCNRCHGSKNQEADLQLNRRSNTLDHSGVIKKLDADASLLIKRLVDSDEGDLMPLDSDPLSEKEVDVLKQWINQGADWPDELAEAMHWAYQPVQRATLSNGIPSGSVIDHFVASRLQSQGLQPSPPLDRSRLIRRVSLALTGIPPSPTEVDEFINDRSKDAYEKVVNRLLQSPRYGERWAVPWLDLARYADSNGFQADQIRDNWAYRDWVVRALNDGMPINQFVIEQLAGDLLENPTADQKTATGFHRMTTCNVEAGVHPEANRVNQVVDRVNTTATVFLGSTLECAQCHDHKYDPFTQKDYYQLFAYFNNTPLEVKQIAGVTWDFYGPKMDLPMEATLEQKYASLQEELKQLKKSRALATKSSDKDFESWLAGLKEQTVQTQWTNAIPENFHSTGDEQFTIEEDGAVLLTGSVPDTAEYTFTLAPEVDQITAIRLDVLTDDAIPGKGPGRGDPVRSNFILSEFKCELITDKETIALTLQDPTADYSQPKWEIAKAIDGNRKTGWAVAAQFGKPHWASFAFASPIDFDAGSQQLRVSLAQYFGQGRVIGKPKLSFYSGDTSFLNVDEALRTLAGKQKLSKADRKKLRKEFDKHNPKLQAIDREIARVTQDQNELKPDTTLVMVEMEEQRETFVMLRGDYETLGDKVEASPPAVLPRPDSIERTGDRLELARWITAPENPLFSRVTVNRWWGEIFGTGLVGSPEDFGSQAEAPSHPEILDWLASELVESGWSMKHVHKLMVMSGTFQQSARVTPALLEVDPKNRLLSRGPRFRLPAESIRDNALAISGLLSAKMFGPPIMPHQPDDIWRSVGRNQPKWIAAEDEDRFRRGLYVVWKRAAPYPSFITFDAPDRGSCTVNRGRSNTPLQALTMLNDPAYAEMALAMADRVISESPSSDDRSRIQHAFKLAVSRGPTEHEIELVQELLDRERQTLRKQPELVASRTKPPFKSMALRTQSGEPLAAWFAVANAILNLDETMNQ
ncbi:MAG: PSD1 and planctomycete cytochrome C domain-containing protein [Rubripirellula sp.]